jgi:YVTN family beta-propeller protein
VHYPGDTLRLLVSASNPGPAVTADVFVGFVFPEGALRLLDPSLSVVSATLEDPATLVPVLASVVIPEGFVFPRPSDLQVDTNGDGLPDAAPVLVPLDGWPVGSYLAFVALTEPGSAAAGTPRLLAALTVAPFEVRAMGAASASSATAITPDGRRVFVVNPDSGSVSAVSTETDAKTAEVPVGREPHSLALGPEGRRVYVASQGSATLTVLDAASLAPLATIPVGAEPYGVVVDPRGHLVYVASSALAAVEVVDARLGQVVGRIPVGPKPKGLAVSADAARLYVTHFLSGEVSVIDLGRRTVVEVVPTGVDSNMAQKIALHPANGRAYLPHIRSNVVNRALLFDTTVFPVVSVIDLGSGRALSAERLDLPTADRPLNLPFDLAFSPDGQRLYVVHLGSGDLSAIDLASGRGIAHVEVGDGPRGIVLTRDGRKAYVANSLSEDVSVIDLDLHAEIRRIPVTTSPLPPEIKRGRLLFFSSRGPELARDRWMGCASCHFEGEHDGRTWFFASRGPRNTTSLRGAGDTRPLHWSADRDEVQDFELTIRQLQAGSGLISDGVPHPALGAPNAGRSVDLDALAAFVQSLSPKPSPFRNSGGSLTAAERGRLVFERPDVGCTACHPPPRFTDSLLTTVPFVRHDVGTGDGTDERLGPAFDTPSLRGLWDSAPYLHDGSAPTLLDVLTTRNVGDRHAPTSHLSQAELQDLIAFLLSL